VIQVRNVPDSLPRTLKARAAQEGMSLSDYLRAEMERIVQRPTLTELLRRLANRSRVAVSVSAADVLRTQSLSRGVRGKYLQRFAKGSNMVVLDRRASQPGESKEVTRAFPKAR